MNQHSHPEAEVPRRKSGTTAKSGPQSRVDSTEIVATLSSNDSVARDFGAKTDGDRDILCVAEASAVPMTAERREIVSSPAEVSDSEERSIAYADADGWRCFYPASRGHLTAAQARAEMRAARGLPPESSEERDAAEFLLLMESAWGRSE